MNLFQLIIGESGRFPDLAQMFMRNFEKPIIEKMSYLFAHHPDLNVADPETTARFFIGNMMHYIIVQEMLNSRDILPMERDRFVAGSIDLIIGSN